MHEALQQCITARSVDVSAIRCRRHVQNFFFCTDANDLRSKRFSAHHIHSHFHLEDGNRDGMMFPRVRITPLIDLASDTGNTVTRVSESDARLLALCSYSNRPLL